ncbi:MAG: hypothetical protein WD851_00270 [Pirellulales bacterium]
MRLSRSIRSGFAWLELLLVLALVAVLFQAFPSLWFTFLSAADVRSWSRDAWIGLNVAAVLVLFAIRFRTELRQTLVAVRSSTHRSRSTARTVERETGNDADYDARRLRDAEWRERARKRLPFT